MSQSVLLGILQNEEVLKLIQTFYEITGVAADIADLAGKVLLEGPFPDLCREFHKVHPETAKICHLSNTFFRTTLSCENACHKCENGLYDAAVPIYWQNRPLGFFLIGQFFPETDPPNYDYFAQKAKKYGFDEEKYLTALTKIPVLSEMEIDKVLCFYKQLATCLTSFAEKAVVLAQELNFVQGEENLLENLPFSAVIIDKSFSLTAYNSLFRKECIRFLKCSPQEGMKVEELLSGISAADTWIRRLERAFVGEVFECEDSLTEANEKIYFSSKYSPVLSKQKEIGEIIIITQHITAQKNIQADIKNKYSRYQRLLEANAETVFAISRTGEIIDYSFGGKLKKIAEKRDLKGKHISNLRLSAANLQTVQLALGEASVTGKDNETLMEANLENQLFVFRLTIHVAGENEFFLFFSDVTELTKALNNALEFEKKYSLLFDLYPCGIQIIDNSGQKIQENLAAARILQGCSLLNADKVKLFRESGEAIPPKLLHTYITLMQGKQLVSLNVRCQRPFTDRDLYLKIFSGKISEQEAFLFFLDISGEKLCEKEYVTLSNRLLSAQNELDYLLGNLRENLYFSLKSFQSTLKILLEENSSLPKLKCSLEHMDSDAEEAMSLAHNLIYWAKLRNNPGIEPETFDALTAFEEAFLYHRELIETKKLRINLKIEPFVHVFADRAQIIEALKQVFFVICKNLQAKEEIAITACEEKENVSFFVSLSTLLPSLESNDEICNFLKVPKKELEILLAIYAFTLNRGHFLLKKGNSVEMKLPRFKTDFF